MKRLIGSLTAKITACVLLCISLGAMILCGIGAIVLAKSDVYFDGGRSFRNTLLDNSTYHYESYLYDYADAVMFPDHYDFDTVSYEDLFNEENCNYFFTIHNTAVPPESCFFLFSVPAFGFAFFLPVFHPVSISAK